MIQSHSVQIIDGIVCLNDEKIGILQPSYFDGVNESGKKTIQGVRGLYNSDGTDQDYFNGLIETGSILFGTEDEVHKIQGLLSDDLLSRTVSYLMCYAKNCQHLLEIIRNIKTKKIAIVGCGGIGSLTATLLAGSGFSKIKLFDHDHIEKSNFNRQLIWRSKDLGRKKVNVLSKTINDMFDITPEIYDVKVSKSNLSNIIACDVIVLSADEPIGVLQREILSECEGGNKLIFVCGYSHNVSYLRVYGPGKRSMEYIPMTESKTEWKRPGTFIAPSFGPTNVLLAGMIVSNIIRVEFLEQESVGVSDWGMDEFKFDTINFQSEVWHANKRFA